MGAMPKEWLNKSELAARTYEVLGYEDAAKRLRDNTDRLMQQYADGDIEVIIEVIRDLAMGEMSGADEQYIRTYFDRLSKDRQAREKLFDRLSDNKLLREALKKVLC